MNYHFNPQQAKSGIIAWIQSQLADSPTAKAVIGISGGKDSAISAALCKEALGKDRVIGVLLPNGEQSDISVSREICEYLGIYHIEINISEAVNGLYNAIFTPSNELVRLNPQGLPPEALQFNTPPRIRMTALYAVAAAVGGRVVNTCNYSETYVGWETKFGDAAGDFSPLSDLTVAEVKKVGYELGLPAKFIEKTPIDGLCGKTDEEGLGVTYETLDRYIREGKCDNQFDKSRIDELHRTSEHKRIPMPFCQLTIDN